MEGSSAKSFLNFVIIKHILNMNVFMAEVVFMVTILV